MLMSNYASTEAQRAAAEEQLAAAQRAVEETSEALRVATDEADAARAAQAEREVSLAQAEAEATAAATAATAQNPGTPSDAEDSASYAAWRALQDRERGAALVATATQAETQASVAHGEARAKLQDAQRAIEAARLGEARDEIAAAIAEALDNLTALVARARAHNGEAAAFGEALAIERLPKGGIFLGAAGRQTAAQLLVLPGATLPCAAQSLTQAAGAGFIFRPALDLTLANLPFGGQIVWTDIARALQTGAVSF